MHQVRVDIEKNRLYIILGGTPTDEEARQTVREVMDAVDKLKSGFDVINDVSALQPLTPEGSEQIIRAQQYIQKAGVRRVVRVVGKLEIIKMQFRRTAMRAGYTSGTDANIATSIEQAERMLDRK
jgi:hypothetical protein